ncbi:MAG: ExeA family protein [Thermodesulfobacteriota bacterium]
MYEKFFYLRENPFNITPDPRYLFLSKSHAEAIELMSYGVRRRKGFMLLTGEVGTGKTTLCRALLGRLPGTTESALILNPVLSDIELLRTINHDFGLDLRSDSLKDNLDALNDFLLKTNVRGGNAVIIIDEAQKLSPRALEMLRLLSNLETDREKLLQIVMVGQPEFRSKLRMSGLRQLNQRVIVRHHLEPLDAGDTGGYIANRLRVAGAESRLAFSPSAVRLVHETSHGIPRMINIICDRTLTAAFIDETRTIGEGTVKKAVLELTREGYVRMPGLAAAAAASPMYLDAGAGGFEGAPFYERYIPHIAVSTFAMALAAGFLWIHFVLNNSFLTAYLP